MAAPVAGAPRPPAAVGRGGREPDAAAQPGGDSAKPPPGGGAGGRDRRRSVGSGTTARRAGGALRPPPRRGAVRLAGTGPAALPDVLRDVGPCPRRLRVDRRAAPGPAT